MSKYYGPIKSKKAAEALASKLDKVGSPEADGAAKMLRNNWHYVAARPMVAAKMIAIQDDRAVSVDRPGSILNTIVNAK